MLRDAPFARLALVYGYKALREHPYLTLPSYMMGLQIGWLAKQKK
jgi:hypothetical protein